ncbi:phosphotransferase [Streptomyces sp. NPDC051940]|uniref:phosphotransferase enzyme family protein n=1 Tax=Streptomyces sp. NPDC051940 TaxID=3155675 RepID=UPI00341C44E8
MDLPPAVPEAARPEPDEPPSRVLAPLLARAGLPAPLSVRRITGRGFDNAVWVLGFGDGRRVVLRSWREPREAEDGRFRFLADHGLPVPELLAASGEGSLYAFADGELLGDLIESGRATDAVWRAVGRAYGRVHGVGFPERVRGKVRPGRLWLESVDPVAELHGQVDACAPGLHRLAPGMLPQLAELHTLVDEAADALRADPVSLLHGDANMWNCLVDGDRCTVIDWDGPRVGSSAKEIALLDKHAWLFGRRGLPSAFFTGYGRPRAEPVTSLQRVVQTVHWAVSDDWDDFRRPALTDELRARAMAWLERLTAYARRLDEHVRAASAAATPPG